MIYAIKGTCIGSWQSENVKLVQLLGHAVNPKNGNWLMHVMMWHAVG
jgi:hypothetical protein